MRSLRYSTSPVAGSRNSYILRGDVGSAGLARPLSAAFPVAIALLLDDPNLGKPSKDRAKSLHTNGSSPQCEKQIGSPSFPTFTERDRSLGLCPGPGQITASPRTSPPSKRAH